MIRRLRRRHRATWLALAVLLPMLYVIALARAAAGAGRCRRCRRLCVAVAGEDGARAMSHGYRAVGWTPHKKIYDAVLAGGVVLYLGLFVGLGLALDANATIETQLIRALGTCALLLLHVILAIGPLARLDRRFLPLLYNRRHLGVTMFLLALGARGVRHRCSSTRSATSIRW